jgi:hypothetical protein
MLDAARLQLHQVPWPENARRAHPRLDVDVAVAEYAALAGAAHAAPRFNIASVFLGRFAIVRRRFRIRRVTSRFRCCGVMLAQ